MAKKRSVVRTASERRDAMLKPKWSKPLPLTQKQRETILALLIEGATLSEVFTMRGIASYGAFYVTRTADAEFDAAVRNALVQGAETAIAEAAQVTRDAVMSNNPDDMRIAEAFHRCAVAYAEKVAPREYGQLVKLGGVDGGALSVQVMNYSLGADVGKLRLEADGSRARAIEAQFEELDPT